MNNFSVCRAVEHIRKARLTELKARETSCPNGKKVWMRKCRTIRIFRRKFLMNITVYLGANEGNAHAYEKQLRNGGMDWE